MTKQFYQVAGLMLLVVFIISFACFTGVISKQKKEIEFLRESNRIKDEYNAQNEEINYLQDSIIATLTDSDSFYYRGISCDFRNKFMDRNMK